MRWSTEQGDSKRDMLFIGNHYPKIRQTQCFQKHLGEATVIRRQYLAKRKEEHDKKQYAYTTTRKDQLSTARRHQHEEIELELTIEGPDGSYKLADSDATAEKRPSLFLALRIPKLNIPSVVKQPLEDDPDRSCLTLSRHTDVDTGPLRAPTMPKEATAGRPFECSYCYEMQQFRNQLEWE